MQFDRRVIHGLLEISTVGLPQPGTGAIYRSQTTDDQCTFPSMKRTTRATPRRPKARAQKLTRLPTARNRLVVAKPGSSFEQLTAILFGSIAASDIKRVIRIRKNAVLQGKSTHHEVDVFWRLQVGNVTYHTVIQAKDWSKPVDQGEVLKLKGVLDDLPHQPRGVMVSPTGFQRGAKDVAAANGILLFQLTPDSSALSLSMTTSSIAQVKIEYRKIPVVKGRGHAWSVQRRAQPFMRLRVMIPEDMRVCLHGVPAGAGNVLPRFDPADVYLVKSGQGRLTSIAGLAQQGLQHAAKYSGDHFAACWMFKPPVLLERRDGSPIVAGIWAIETDFRIVTHEDERPMTSRSWVSYLIRDVLSNETSSIRLEKECIAGPVPS